MNNKYTGLLGKIEEFNKIKVTYEETVANYNALLVQFNNLQLLVQKTGLSKTTDYTKDNEI